MENFESLIPLKWIIANLLLFLGLLVFIILLSRKFIEQVKKEADIKLTYQKNLLENSIQIQEKERTRIAAEIHDDLIAQLYQLKLLSEQENLVPVITKSIQTARAISHELFPPLLEKQSLEETFEGFLFPLKKKYQIEFIVQNRLRVLFENQVKLHLFRIFQEVLTNIEKHAQTKSIKIDLKITKQYVFLAITDFGIGFEAEKLQTGLGFKNIELRARQIQATYKFEPNQPKGCKFLLLYDFSN